MNRTTKKQLAALLEVTPTRVQQLMVGLLMGEDFWYEQENGHTLCIFSDEAVQKLRNREKKKMGRPRKYPMSDKPKRPRGRPKKEKAPA